MSSTLHVVTSRSNARVKQLRAAFAGQARLSDGLVAIEGEHLLREALRSGLSLKTVFLQEHIELPRWVPYASEIIRLSDDVFRSAVETQSPQGLAALIAPRRWELEDVLGQKRPALILIACGLQDPGNLGTLIRSSEAFGATGVITTRGTASAWNQKAIRASVGSIFRVPMVTATLDEIAGLRARGVRLLATTGAATQHVQAASNEDMRSACALLIGNEGAGLSEEWTEIADARITVPCPGPVESLNAAIAGSLLLYEASRQRSA